MTKKTAVYLKVIVPLLGIGSLIWFLVRVIPKPSRAAYPCMRVAAPLASTFVLWLLGIMSSFLFFKHARMFFVKTRYITGALCLVTGAIVGGSLISSSHSRALAKVNTTGIIGVAKGANPGRVVWVHDKNATPWKGLGNGHWWEKDNTNQTVVDQMMSRTLLELSGKTTDAAAWDTLFRYFNVSHKRNNVGYVKGEKIAVKTNLTYCNFFPAYCCVDSMTYALNKKLDYMNTSPQMVRSLLRQLVNVVGVNQADIYLGDPVAYYPNEYYDSCHAEFPNVHYIDHAGKFNRTKAEFSTTPMYWSSRPTDVKQDYILKHYNEATYIISLANMKSHGGGGITLCAKNHYGSFIRLPADSGYFNLHNSLAFLSPDMGSYRALVDIMGSAHLGGKTLLYLVDGLYEGNHNKDTIPHTWKAAPFNGGYTSSVFASQDPVAIESVMFDIFQFDEDSSQFSKMAGAQDYLIEAAQANNPPSGTFYDPDHATPTSRLQSLGVYEHWNNGVDRKYSRNLGTGNGIELVFIEGATNAIEFHKNQLTNSNSYSLTMMGKTSTLELFVPQSENLNVSIFNAQGKKIQTIVDGVMTKGTHRLNLQNTMAGNKLSFGMYQLVLSRKSGGKSEVIKTCNVRLSGR